MAASPGGDGRAATGTPVTALDERAGGTLEERILDATLRCVARWGVAKTTLDDIAREAGCSRATVYRCFPGGKDVLLLAAGDAELARLLADLDARLAGAATLDELVVTAVLTAGRAIAASDALQYLCEHEPDVVRPYLSFDGLDPLLAQAVAVGGPHLGRFLPPADAADAAEWVARLIVSYAFEPVPGVDLTHEGDVRRLVHTFVLPGLAADATIDLSVPPVPADPAAPTPAR